MKNRTCIATLILAGAAPGAMSPSTSMVRRRAATWSCSASLEISMISAVMVLSLECILNAKKTTYNSG